MLELDGRPRGKLGNDGVPRPGDDDRQDQEGRGDMSQAPQAVTLVAGVVFDNRFHGSIFLFQGLHLQGGR
jgi:hypothetical protein